jgi:hypothetical protein
MSDKGLELERLVTNLFKAKGYDARHNVKMRGRSGVEHQIDVYAEYRAPLHVSKIIVECKSYDKPIDKDVVMKLIHEVEDLGVDKGILVTTSYFTPDAISTAQGYNVELWDGAKLRELLREVPIEEGKALTNVYYVEPAIHVDEAVKTVDSTLKGVLGRKGSIESGSLVFYPYYEVDVDARVQELKGLIKKKVEARVVSATVLVDAVTGALCDYDPKVGVVGVASIPPLSDEEARAFRILSSGALNADMLASLLSCSTAKARKILQGLVAKGVARVVSSGRQVLYELGEEIPEPSSLRPLTSTVNVKSGEPRDGVKVNVLIGLEGAQRALGLLWEGVVKGYKMIFYPYYACKIVTDEGKRYCKAVDMLTKRVDERVSKVLTSMYLELPF